MSFNLFFYGIIGRILQIDNSEHILNYLERTFIR